MVQVDVALSHLGRASGLPAAGTPGYPIYLVLMSVGLLLCIGVAVYYVFSSRR